MIFKISGKNLKENQVNGNSLNITSLYLVQYTGSLIQSLTGVLILNFLDNGEIFK